ncbi:MAG: electron transfer flavoprotein subunit alpha/FixB family protein, partial [Oxalicibacterium faecigallinarum]|nr:electron transfer flavoprotein subunit alpha/FixB family protein [Oxalicibacterium faecigallinarum]
MTALVLADHDNQSLKPATLSAVAAALQCSADVHVLVAGSRCDAVAAAAANIQGVTRVLMADGAQFADGLPENVAQQVHALGLTGSYT